jgi:hypothetical protein
MITNTKNKFLETAPFLITLRRDCIECYTIEYKIYIDVSYPQSNLDALSNLAASIDLKHVNKIKYSKIDRSIDIIKKVINSKATEGKYYLLNNSVDFYLSSNWSDKQLKREIIKKINNLEYCFHAKDKYLIVFK